MLNTHKLLLFPVSILAAAMLIGFGVVAYGSSPQDIVFPVAELGNCENKGQCQVYCERPENYEACTAFAEKHNLIDERQADKSRKLAAAIKGGGPGGCSSRASCEVFCDNVKNIEACLAYAEEHDIMGAAELDEAKQIAKALRSGVAMPGGCTGKNQCDAYCEDSSHIRECVAFAEKAGLISVEELAEVKKIMPLMESGQMPGGCRSKRECNSYCSNADHRQECMDFALKAGFMSPKEAEMMIKTGGRGPGDCGGREACEAFCNDRANRQTCMNFAKEHGLMSEQDLKQMEEGLVKMKEGLSRAPAEVVNCLKDKLGSEIVEKIRSGELMPGPEIGDQMSYCFDEFAPRITRQQLESQLSQIPASAKACLVEKLGSNYLDVLTSRGVGSESVGDVARDCMDDAMFAQIREQMSRMPAEVQQCIQSKLGSNFIERVKAGELDGEAMGAAMKGCAEQFMPKMQEGMPPGDGQAAPGAYPQPTGELSPMPPEAKECMTGLYGADVFDRMRSGTFMPPADMQTQIQQCVMRFFQQQQQSVAQ